MNSTDMVHHPKTGRDKQMSQGDSVEEKLVQVVVSWLNTFSTYDYPLPMPQDKKEHFAKLIITDTLKAVVDGELELLGEYYRGDGVNIEQIEATRALFRRRSAEDQKDLMGYEYALDDLLDVAHSIYALDDLLDVAHSIIAFLSPTEEK